MQLSFIRYADKSDHHIYMSSVFLSHSHQDKSFARRLASDVRAAGHIVWIDEAEIKIGDSLIEKIREGIDEVDYVAALLSLASIESQWVKKELDIAMNKEIEEKRVLVLPLLLDDVELPGFLKGKLYADFTSRGNYGTALEQVLNRLGPGAKQPSPTKEEMEVLRHELEKARRRVERQGREIERRSKLISIDRSPELEEAILRENERRPEFAHINEAYAFDTFTGPITLGYMLFAASRARFEGGHQLEGVLTIDEKWDRALLMLEAYSDFVGSSQSA